MRANFKSKTLTILLTVFFLLITGCKEKGDPNAIEGFIQIKGSDTMINAEQKIAEEFMKDYTDVSVAVTGGGSGVGIASLLSKTCDIAAASREIEPKEIEMANKKGVSPKEFTIAYDGVAVIVNKDNPVEKLTIGDLYKIFTGKATNWKEFGGKDMKIVTLSREVSSGTHAYFKEQVIHLGKKDSVEEFASGTLLLSSSQSIVEEVAANEASIGYLGMGYVSDRTKTSHIEGKDGQFYAATIENVLANKYPLSRGLYFLTNGEPQGITKLFIDFTLSDKGQQQFKESGFVPVGARIAQKI